MPMDFGGGGGGVYSKFVRSSGTCQLSVPCVPIDEMTSLHSGQLPEGRCKDISKHPSIMSAVWPCRACVTIV